MIKILLLTILIFLIPVKAQELNENQLDSLYNAFLRMNDLAYIQADQPETEIVKCGLGIISQIKFNLEKYSLEKQQLLKSLLQRPTKQTSMVSPSGFFRIHYNTTGTDVPRYNPSLTTEQNVMEVGIALDSSFNFEVNFLGYPAPPSDNGAGGDNLYDVYIENLGNFYGYTEQETSLGNQKFTSFIVIDDNYAGFPTTGLAGMKVTVAHEFHHAIQMGNYIFRGEDLFFYELTSTSMEEFVYDDVNDYYFYMSNYFDDPGKPFASFRSGTADGYDLAIWNIFLKDKFGFEIIKRQWEMMPSTRALSAIQNSLIENSSSFNDALNSFGIWTFFTGHRARSGAFFEEASEYPLVDFSSVINFTSPSSVLVQSKPTANNFIAFLNSSVNPVDTLVTIITNSDVEAGINNQNGNFQFNYVLSLDSSSGFERLNESYFAQFNYTQSVFSVSEILNNQVIRENGIVNPPLDGTEDFFVFPNPYFYNKDHNSLYIIIKDNEITEYDFNVYTSGMELVYSKKLPVTNDFLGRRVLRWDIRSLNKNLSTGVYIFAVQANDKTSKGKLVIFNE